MEGGDGNILSFDLGLKWQGTDQAGTGKWDFGGKRAVEEGDEPQLDSYILRKREGSHSSQGKKFWGVETSHSQTV